MRCVCRPSIDYPDISYANLDMFAGLEKFGYSPEDMVILTDDAENPAQLPTKANMERAMQWLVAGAQPNDSLFFHCA